MRMHFHSAFSRKFHTSCVFYIYYRSELERALAPIHLQHHNDGSVTCVYLTEDDQETFHSKETPAPLRRYKGGDVQLKDPLLNFLTQPHIGNKSRDNFISFIPPPA